jgi:DeoR/GlpR family transcriptional regulator of sugar metabolism
MLAKLRRQRILEVLRSSGGARLAELAETLDVSEMTVRRDLDVLQSEGLVERVHGGAMLVQFGSEEPGFDKKVKREQAEKEAIARRAALMARPGMAVALSAGTTTWLLARELALVEGLTVVTNSLDAWAELQRPGRLHAVILTGGENRTPSGALVGPTADAAIRSLYFDLLFLGVHGFDPVAGVTTPNVGEAETNRAFISRSRRLVVVADHTKWRTTALCSMAALSDVDTLVTDDGLADDARRQLESHVGELVLAPVARQCTTDLRSPA